MAFMDDITLHLMAHVQHLKEALQVSTGNKLFAKASKCCFSQTQIEYMGHTIYDQGTVVSDPSKMTSMLSWPTPQSTNELRVFCVIQNFIKNYGLLAKPLIDLPRLQLFAWSILAQVDFDKLINWRSFWYSCYSPMTDAIFQLESCQGYSRVFCQIVFDLSINQL